MKKFSTLKITIKSAIAPTIVATLIFFLTYYLFGSENSMIGPFATLSFLRFRSMNNHYECMIKTFLIYGVMAVLAYLAALSFPLCILVNAIALFWITGFLIDEYNPTNYFPTGMALIFFQIAPVSGLAALSNRIAALAATFVLIMIFVLILSKREHPGTPLSELFRNGFDICQKQLNAIHTDAKPDEMEQLHHELCDINKKCSSEIYSYNRATLRRSGKTNWYCQFILVFQIINYLTSNADIPGNPAKADMLYHRYLEILHSGDPQPVYRRFYFRERFHNLKNIRLRFALRQVIVLTPCIVFAHFSGLHNAYWLVISVFFMMIPFTDDTISRVRQRVVGTIAGIVICLILFSVFPGFGARVVIMTIANFFIYGANGYGPTVAYITCSALALQTINDTVTIVLLERLIYTVIGAVIAILANRLIFPIRMQKQISYLMELIVSLRQEMLEITRTTEPGDARRRKELDQRIVKIYLLSKRLETLGNALADEKSLQDYRSFEKEHILFLAEYFSEYFI